MSREVGVIGAGMIMRDQNGPALAELVRAGVIGNVRMAATASGSIREFLDLPWWKTRYPDLAADWITTYPDRSVDPGQRNPHFWKEMLSDLPEGSIVLVATPDFTHEEFILAALEKGCHVVTVKSLCTTYAGARRIQQVAYARGLFVGIDFHKRWDHRALITRQQWQSGVFGVPTAAQGTMIEDDSYIRAGTPFAKHFTPDTSDPFTYVGCHYVDQFCWWTGLRPVQVTANGFLGRFESGVQCYSWAGGQVVMNNGAILQLVNGLQFPSAHRGRNHQGIRIWGYDPKTHEGTYCEHIDNGRGMDFVRINGAPGKRTDAGSDYVGWIPRMDGGPGLTMVGYGFRAIDGLIRAAIRVGDAGDLAARQRVIREIDEADLIPTPGNTGYLQLVYEAARSSILNGGFPYRIDEAAGVITPMSAPPA